MRCEQASELVGAYLDQELEADARRELAAHLAGCAHCTALADDYRRMSLQFAAMGRQPLPEHLPSGVRARLAQETDADAVPRRALSAWRPPERNWLWQAAAVLLLCGATAAGTGVMVARIDTNTRMEREVAAAHVRSLLQDSPMQVASSEQHVVKPWFTGRLDFSPAVKDLAAEGFPLAGARLDYIGERRVAALVYKRRLHVVNVFLWPSPDGIDRAPHEIAHRGFNMLTWSKGGLTYWAISDLNVGELRQLQSQL